MPLRNTVVILKSAGEMASGIAVRLYGAGVRRLLMLETAQPLAVRRTVSFSEAVYETRQCVEGVTARLAASPEAIETLWRQGDIAVAVDPAWSLVRRIPPGMLVDATIAKRNLGTHLADAPLVVALGPGFVAGVDAHFVVETHRGHDLGRIYSRGAAAPNTGIPGDIGGYTAERVLRSPAEGRVEAHRDIGDLVRQGDSLFTVNGREVRAAISGVLRGCIRPGVLVGRGTKLGDIDPRGEAAFCRSVSEKARALGGSVLEILCRNVSGL